MRKYFYAYFFIFIFFISGCKEDDQIIASNVRDITGKWVGLASDDGQLGTGGLSSFIFEITQNNTNATGNITVVKTATSLTYTSSFNGIIANSDGFTTFEGSFDITIQSSAVHVDFSSVYDNGQLVGSFSGTNSSFGKITGGSFILSKK